MATTRVGLAWERGHRPNDLAADVADYGRRLLDAIRELAAFFAARIEAWARKNAAWTDRTGNARSGLTGRAIPTATGAIVVLFHAVSYGIWLELANAGRLAIVLKALQTHHPEIVSALRRLVGG
jgi:hypothetical protein